jgi:hypothetical protein
MEECPHDIDTTKYIEAHNLLIKAKEKFAKIITQTDTTPACIIAINHTQNVSRNRTQNLMPPRKLNFCLLPLLAQATMTPKPHLRSTRRGVSSTPCWAPCQQSLNLTSSFAFAVLMPMLAPISGRGLAAT